MRRCDVRQELQRLTEELSHRCPRRPTPLNPSISVQQRTQPRAHRDSSALWAVPPSISTFQVSATALSTNQRPNVLNVLAGSYSSPYNPGAPQQQPEHSSLWNPAGRSEPPATPSVCFHVIILSVHSGIDQHSRRASPASYRWAYSYLPCMHLSESSRGACSNFSDRDHAEARTDLRRELKDVNDDLLQRYAFDFSVVVV